MQSYLFRFRQSYLLAKGSSVLRQYMEGVLSGVIVACEWVKLACQRQKEDLERFAASGLYIFNEAKGNEVCRFIELLTHTKGALAGKRIVLEPWQIFILTTSFGWRRRADGGRRFRRVYIEVPRGNGKSSLSSGVGLYCLPFMYHRQTLLFKPRVRKDQRWTA